MKKPLISIVTVSLNTKNKLIKTLKNLNQQNKKIFELIIIDGKSSDGSIQLIKDNYKWVSSLIVESDKGIYDAMNKGIYHAQGEWLCFMNSGDIFSNKNFLNSIKKKLIKLKDQDVIYGNTIVDYKYTRGFREAKIMNSSTYLMPFNHQSVFVKTNLAKKNVFNIKYKIASDFNFFYHLFMLGKKFCKINKTFSIVESGGFSDKSRFRTLNEYKIIKKKYHKSLSVDFFYFLIFIFFYINFLIKKILPQFLIKKITKIKNL